MPKVTYLSYYDIINEQKARSFMEACAQAIAQTNPDQLYFLFSSSGGSVDAGISIYNFLRALPVPIVMHNTGSIDSIANVIFLAADERWAAPQAGFLFHGINWGFGQGATLAWTQLQEVVSNFKAAETRVIAIIKERTALSEGEIAALFHQGESKDLAFAKSKGIIKDVRPAKVPPGATLVALNFA